MLPLLSICIPTFNGAHKLRLTLQALLPQVAEHPGEVEVWVSDNASTTNTREVVENAQALGPVNYSRNDTNIGFHGNLVKAALKLARGEYLWPIGDDDILTPGAISRVLAALANHSEYDSFLLNYRWANYPTHWPENAIGGYAGEFEKLYLPDVNDKRIDCWKEYLSNRTHLCVQFYNQVIRRQIWVDYWQNKQMGPELWNFRTLFPHCELYAATLMHKPSYYIGEPCSTCFMGSQIGNGAIAEILGAFEPLLIVHYKRGGLSGQQLDECKAGAFGRAHTFLAMALQNPEKSCPRLIKLFMKANWRYPKHWPILIRAIRLADRPRLASKALGVLGYINKRIGGATAWGAK